ncbi:uncharacterized protein LOC135102310 [Scylla paramamosain]|uniref:uncharacterized protein LOC135102310 n=1 Tax=Scylla paramamosain TaxID=85552 RepID=UPI0030831AA0
MKACLEILRVAVLNKEDARTPTQLTVSYKGWWHTPLLHVPLAMEPLRDGVHATRKGGKIALVQRFASGKAPTFRVKGRSSKLEIRLYARRTLRTRVQVEVGHLVCGTAERLLKVPFEVKVGGKVEKAFLVVAQTSPVPTPPPPPIYPVGHKRLSSPPVPKCSFPLGEYEPSQARLKFLVQEMYGPMPDPGEWLVPASPSGARCSAAEATPLAGETHGEADDGSEECEANSVGVQTDGVVQESTDSARCSPQTSPRAVGDRYVRLWNAAFGERAESTPRQEQRRERRRPSLSRITSFERLCTTVFGEATDCEEEDQVSLAQAGVRQTGPQTRVFGERPGRQQREASEDPSVGAADQPAEVSARCVRLWNEVFGEVQNVSDTRRITLTPARRNPSPTPPRETAKRTPSRVASLGTADQPVAVSARWVWLWNEVFGEVQ